MRARAGRGWWWLVACALLAGGCGGDSGPTAAERKAAKQRWVARADAECEKVNKAIADRGWPADLVDLDRLVARGVADARAGLKRIVSLRIPEGAGPAPGALVEELRRLDPVLADFSSASEGLEPRPLLRMADRLKPRLSALEDRARAAGLTECGQNDERFLIPDGVRGPVFAEQLAKVERSLIRRLDKLNRTKVRSPAGAADLYGKLSELTDDLIAGIDRLDPPQWAARQTSKYQSVLTDAKALMDRSQNVFAEHAGTLTPAKVARLQRQWRVMIKRERKARRKMLRAVGAAPTTRPPDDGGGGTDPIDPDGEQVS